MTKNLTFVAATLFALTSPAFPQGIEIGPGGIEVDPGFHEQHDHHGGYGRDCVELRQA